MNTRAPPSTIALFGSTFREMEFSIDFLIVRNHFIIVMIRWTGLAPWEFDFTFLGSLISKFVEGWVGQHALIPPPDLPLWLHLKVLG